MRFSFAIVCSNDHCLLECLKSIQEDIPIIVVQNFPDKYVQTICENDKRISIFRCDERNLGKLRQIAADNCETPGICYIDSDCVIERGLVNIVEDELDHYCAINIPMIYRYHNRSTKIVSECRRFTTSDRLLLVPFAFRLDIQKKIGSLFNTALVELPIRQLIKYYMNRNLKEKFINNIYSVNYLRTNTLNSEDSNSHYSRK